MIKKVPRTFFFKTFLEATNFDIFLPFLVI